MVRWDAPLFTVLWSDESVPGEQIWDAISKGNVKPPNSGTLSVRSFRFPGQDGVVNFSRLQKHQWMPCTYLSQPRPQWCLRLLQHPVHSQQEVWRSYPVSSRQ